MTPTQLQDLLRIKQSLGIPDPRYGLKECELCDNDGWRPGVMCSVPSTNTGQESNSAPDPQLEGIVKTVTEQIMARLQSKG